MKPSPFSVAISDAIRLKLKAVDKLITDMIEPLEEVGNPETLIHKPYEEWTADDLQKLSIIYSGKEPNPLNRLVFTKEYEKQLAAELEIR